MPLQYVEFAQDARDVGASKQTAALICVEQQLLAYINAIQGLAPQLTQPSRRASSLVASSPRVCNVGASNTSTFLERESGISIGLEFCLKGWREDGLDKFTSTQSRLATLQPSGPALRPG